jgi:hypothetical protein
VSAEERVTTVGSWQLPVSGMDGAADESGLVWETRGHVSTAIPIVMSALPASSDWSVD